MDDRGLGSKKKCYDLSEQNEYEKLVINAALSQPYSVLVKYSPERIDHSQQGYVLAELTNQ